MIDDLELQRLIHEYHQRVAEHEMTVQEEKRAAQRLGQAHTAITDHLNGKIGIKVMIDPEGEFFAGAIAKARFV